MNILTISKNDFQNYPILDEVRRNINHIFNDLHEFDFVIGGGFITHEIYKNFHNSSFLKDNEQQDIDIFPTEYRDYEKMKSFFSGQKYDISIAESSFGWSEEEDNLIENGFSTVYKNKKINVINVDKFFHKYNVSENYELVQIFDIRACCIMFSRSNIYFLDGVIDDIKKKKLYINSVPNIEWTLQRINKYMNRGFNLDYFNFNYLFELKDIEKSSDKKTYLEKAILRKLIYNIQIEQEEYF